MKQRGFLLAECLIAIVIFLIGVIAVASATAYSLRAIVGSRNAISSDMAVSNIAEDNVLGLAISPDEASLPQNMTAVSSVNAVQDSHKNSGSLVTWDKLTGDAVDAEFRFKCELYRCQAADKFKTMFYLLKWEAVD